MKFIIDIFIRLLEQITGDKKHHLDDLERFNHISPGFSSEIMMIMVVFVFWGTLVLWKKMLMHYLGAQRTKKRVRAMLDAGIK